MYSYDVLRNHAIIQPKKCFKKHNKYDFLQGTEAKLELSNRGHPIACILPPRLINKRFAECPTHAQAIIIAPATIAPNKETIAQR